MAEMGIGYGSECHLLRYLARHRRLLDARVLAATGSQAIQWVDFQFDPKGIWQDAEWKGMDFLPDGAPAKAAWPDFWPQRGNVPNWDAVAEIAVDGRNEWLLVEAKANLGELRSSCKAKPEGGLGKITGVLEEAKESLNVAADRDWLNGYYQHCNRVVALNFLGTWKVSAHLLFLYFTGDRSDPPKRICPPDAAGWSQALDAQAEHVGLPVGHRLAGRIHTMFLPVCA